MSHVPHELHEEFPDAVHLMHSLKLTSEGFARLSDDYHDINYRIHRIETEIDIVPEAMMEDLKRTRLHLKDQIAAHLAAAKHTGA